MTSALRLPPPADVTTLDHDQILGRLTDLLLSLYPWIALDKADLARMHLEGMAHLADAFTFLINRMGRGGRILTADQRRDILALVKLLGYRPRGATAAACVETFTLASAASAVVTIEAGRIVRTLEQANPRRFQLLADVVIDVGQTTATGTVEHSALASDAFLSSSVPAQSFRLTESPYLDGSVVITTAAGAWTEVGNFLDSTSVDRHFTTAIDARDRVTVRFGGINGAGVVPSGLISFAYKTGGGITGNVGAGALILLEGSVADANGVVRQITVTNATASPGFDRESGAQIQQNAPASLSTLKRAVARPDYEAIVEAVPGIAYGLMLTRNQSASVGENEGFLFVVPEDGSVASTPLLTTVAEQYGDAVAVGASGVYVQLAAGPTPKTVTFQLRVRPASYKLINVVARVFLRKGAVQSVVLAAINAALASYFAILVPATGTGFTGGGLVRNPRLNFGYYLQDADGLPTGHLPFSDLYDVVHDVVGVREIGASAGEFTLNGTTGNVPIELWDFPKLGTVQINFG